MAVGGGGLAYLTIVTWVRRRAGVAECLAAAVAGAHRPPEARGLTERRALSSSLMAPDSPTGRTSSFSRGPGTRRSEERSVPEWPRVVFEAKADEEALGRHATTCWRLHEQSGRTAATDLGKA